MERLIKGGGGGGQPDFIVKLDSEIAVDQQTRTRDQTVEGVLDSNRPLVPAVQLVATPIFGPFLVVYEVSSRLDKKWLSNEPSPYAHIWAYALNLIDFGP